MQQIGKDEETEETCLEATIQGYAYNYHSKRVGSWSSGMIPTKGFKPCRATNPGFTS